MNTYHSRTKKTSFVALALLVNIFILLILFYPQQLKQKFHPILNKDEKTKLLQRQEQWAALKPRASQFGAPVIFQNEPALQVQKDQPLTQEKDSLNQPALKDTSPDLAAAPQRKSKTQEKLPHIENEETPTLLKHVIKQVQQQQKTIWEKTSLNSLHEDTQTIANTKKAQSEQNMKHKKQTTPVPAIVKKLQPKPATTKQLTLADITQGFLHQIENEGNNTIKMDGDPNKLPTDEQLKHERYVQRLVWCLQNSLKIHHKYIQNVHDATDPDVFIALNEKGKLEDVRIVKTSTNQELDLFMLFIFKDASSAFPPVPKYLNKKGYRIVFHVDLGNQHRSNIKYSYQSTQ